MQIGVTQISICTVYRWASMRRDMYGYQGEFLGHNASQIAKSKPVITVHGMADTWRTLLMLLTRP